MSGCLHHHDYLTSYTSTLAEIAEDSGTDLILLALYMHQSGSTAIKMDCASSAETASVER